MGNKANQKLRKLCCLKKEPEQKERISKIPELKH